MRDSVINKLLSGKYFLTVMGGIAFVYAVWKRILPPEAVASIITMIFVAYFNKKQEDTNGQK